jgi:hypothetical protein
MSKEFTINRRRFLGVAAGAAGAAALGTWVPRALGEAAGERLVPPGKLGIQQFSIRDSITRLNGSVMGYLGGPDFPEDPTDLGPLVPLPGGYAAVFEYLASLGYRGFEFFGAFNQGANGPITVPEIRAALDAAGLVGQGTHRASLGAMFDPATDGISANGRTEIENAHILGFPQIGTAGDPTSANVLVTTSGPIGWAEAARRANIVGAACAAEGLKWYWHVEQNGYQGFDTTVHPELARTKRMEWFFGHTDPNLVFVEPDTFHGYAGRARFPFAGWSASDPYNPEFLFDLFGWWKANYHRIVSWHVKDGTRLAVQPLPPTNPFTQTIARAGFPLTNGTDALYEGEGSIGQGFPVDPDPAVVGFKRIFEEVGAKGSRFYQAESDSAIGPPPRPEINDPGDPGRSLRHAKLAAQYLLGLRAAPEAQAESTVESEEVSMEHEMARG